MVKRNVSNQTAQDKATEYLLSDASLASLARDYVTSAGRAERVRGTYLSVLVAHSKHELNSRRATIEQSTEAIERVHAHLYKVILDAVVTPEIALSDSIPDEEKKARRAERTRRATFARTAKATLLGAVKAGARLSTMDPAKVTKASLQQYYAQVREDPGTVQDKLQRTEARLETLLRQLAGEDRDAAERFLEELQDKLEGALSESVPGVVQMQGTRKVGELTLHPH